MWHLPEGDFTYAELDLAPDSVEPNPSVVPPASGPQRTGAGRLDSVQRAAAIAVTLAGSPLLPEHQRLQPGDLTRLGMPGSPCSRVASGDPGASLVLVSADPATEDAVPTSVVDATGATWQWQLYGVRGGTATRPVSRQRNAPRRASDGCGAWSNRSGS
ncbi:MAG: hypothetical protein M0Z51_00840 [Propionibacterium sp.]|nr:hypothetical protein [Propionibacterium sp.]